MTNYYRLTIVGDTNDADYVTSVSKISDEDLEDVVKPVVDVLKKRHNWNLNEYCSSPEPAELYAGLLTQEQIEIFNELCPQGEHRIHSITSVSVTHYVDEHVLFGEKYL